MQLRTPALIGFGALALKTLGGGAAYATNGGALLMGRVNGATATTTLVNSTGSALSLNSKAGTSPLRVSNATKVPNLNADRFDDLDSTKFALTAGRTGIIVGSTGDADGFVNTAQCPSGSIATGGGGYASGTRDYLYYSGPDLTGDGVPVPNSWFAVADGATTAWVVCYNPRGTVPNAVTSFDALHARGSATSASSPSTRKSTDPADAPQKHMPIP
jgi:hypothetical protein